jgi:hypothetical protein
MGYLFSSFFLIEFAIIVILIGGLFFYFNYRFTAQDQKIHNMVKLIMEFTSRPQQLQEEELEEKMNQKLKGGNNELISVSDEDDFEDEIEEEEEEEDDENDQQEINSDEEEEEDIVSDRGDISSDEEILEEDDDCEVNDFLEFAEKDTEQKTAETKIIHLDFPRDEHENIIKEELEAEALETFDAETFDAETLDTEVLDAENKESREMAMEEDKKQCDDGDEDNIKFHFDTKYKKLSLNKLKEIALSKGLVNDASKLKKHELLKLLSEE